MKILFANHALVTRGGSELATLELARAFRQSGHDVAVFAMERGPFARSLKRESGAEVYGPGDHDRLRQFEPDIVHSHHLTSALFLKELLPSARKVHEILGILPVLEHPPSSAVGFDHCIVISEEIESHLRKTAFGQGLPVELMRNWFDEHDWSTRPARAASDPLSVVAISNYVAPELRRSLLELERAKQIVVRFVGGPRASVPISADFLWRYDVVVSLGRTAILAAACGVPCVVADRDLSDGLLTPENLSQLRESNFSGRKMAKLPTVDHLSRQFSAARSLDTVQLAALMQADYRLSSRVERLKNLYLSLLAAPRSPQTFPAAEGHAFAQMAFDQSRLRQRFEALKRLSPAGPLFNGLARLSFELRRRGGFR